MIIDIINQYLPMLLQAVLITVFGIVGMVIKKVAQQYITTDTARALAKTAVLFVEQCYKDLHGDDKLAAAMHHLSLLLKDKGITISDNEMIVLLEAAVGEFNNVFSNPKTTAGSDT